MSRRQPTVEVSRSDEIRLANDRIANKAEELRFASRVPMLCECGDACCSTILLIGLDEYRKLRSDGRHRLTAPDHAIEGATVETKQDGYWLQRR